MIYFLKVDNYLKKMKMNENINENIKESQTIAIEDAGHSIFYYEERERLTELCFIG